MSIARNISHFNAVERSQALSEPSQALSEPSQALFEPSQRLIEGSQALFELRSGTQPPTGRLLDLWRLPSLTALPTDRRGWWALPFGGPPTRGKALADNTLASQAGTNKRYAMLSKTALTGAYTALATPFTSDGCSIDLKAFEALVEWQIASGISGLVPCGTTGEAPTLTESELSVLIQKTVQVAKGRVPVLAGTGTFSTKKTIAISNAALEAGADAVMIVMPYYNRPSQRGLVEHVCQVAAAVKSPIVLYNIPGRTGVDLSADATVTICERAPNVIGLKDATNNVLRCQELIRRLGDRLVIMSGDDGLTLAMMVCGASGVISVTSNVLPAQVSEVCRLASDGKWMDARRAHYALMPVHEAMFTEPSPAPMKAALAQKGRSLDVVRAPLVAASEEAKAKVRQALATYEASR